MGHGVEDRARPIRLDLAAAKSVAETLQALATPSRLLILSRLREGPSTVGELAEAVGMEQSAVSHQLRLLRHLGLVDGHRRGRTVSYSLYDDHVAQLLDEAVYHAEHLRLGTPDRGADTGRTPEGHAGAPPTATPPEPPLAGTALPDDPPSPSRRGRG